MFGTHRCSITGVLMVCVLATQGLGTVFASEDTPRVAPTAVLSSPSSSTPPLGTTLSPSPIRDAAARLAASTPESSATAFSAYAQRGYRRGRTTRSSRHAAAAFLAVGALASITGTAVLVYANRPECNVDPFASGCGYGTKVVGGAVLSAGIIGLFAGAAASR